MTTNALWPALESAWRACRASSIPDPRLRLLLGAYMLLTPLTAAADGLSALLLVSLISSSGASELGLAASFADGLGRRLGLPDDPLSRLALAAAALAARAALAVAAVVIDGACAARLRRALQEACFKRLLHARWDALRQGQIGQWGGALTEEAVTFAKYLMSAVRAAYHAAVCLMLCLIALWAAPLLSLAVGAAAAPLWALLRRLYARQSSISAEMAAERQGFAADAIERLAGLFQIKASGEIAEHLDSGLARQEEFTRKETLLAYYFGVISAFSLILMPLALAAFGAASWWRGRPLHLELEALGSLGLIGWRAMGQLNLLIGAAGNLTRLSGSVGPVLRLCELPQERPRLALPAPLAAVELDRVRYALAGRELLGGLSLALRPGSLWLITGPSGAGKTTLANLAAGLLEPASGDIWYHDAEGGRWSSRERRAKIGYVPQEVHLFRGSARRNLDPRGALPDAFLLSCLRRAGAEGFLAPRGGLDADLSEAGRSLSGGERRRLAIAHALAQSSECLILDEFTNGLDDEAKSLLIETALELSKTLIVIAISHDLAAFSAPGVVRFDLAAARSSMESGA